MQPHSQTLLTDTHIPTTEHPTKVPYRPGANRMAPFLALPKKGETFNSMSRSKRSARSTQPDLTEDIDMGGLSLEPAIDQSQYQFVMNCSPEEILTAMTYDADLAQFVMSSFALKSKLFLLQHHLSLAQSLKDLDVCKEKWQPNTALLRADPAVGGLSRTFIPRPGVPVAYRITVRTSPIDDDGDTNMTTPHAMQVESDTWSYFEITRFEGDEFEALSDVEVLPPSFLGTYLTNNAVPVVADLDTDLLFSDGPALLIPPGTPLLRVLIFLDGWHLNGKYYEKFKDFEVRQDKSEFCGKGGLLPMKDPRVGAEEIETEEEEKKARKKREMEEKADADAMEYFEIREALSGEAYVPET